MLYCPNVRAEDKIVSAPGQDRTLKTEYRERKEEAKGKRADRSLQETKFCAEEKPTLPRKSRQQGKGFFWAQDLRGKRFLEATN